MHNLNILKRYSAVLPNLEGAFHEALTIPAAERVDWAKAERANIYRDGWFVNSPVGAAGDGETVDEHVKHLQELIEKYFPEDQKDKATFLAEYHDDHEVIAHAVIDGKKRDLNPEFNPLQGITKADKKVIEELAREVLFEAQPSLLQELNQYHDARDEASKSFRQLDKICVMWTCLKYVRDGYGYESFQRFWDYWNLGNVKDKCGPVVTAAFEHDVWPKIQALKL